MYRRLVVSLQNQIQAESTDIGSYSFLSFFLASSQSFEIFNSQLLFSMVMVLSASSGMCQVFSATTSVHSFLPHLVSSICLDVSEVMFHNFQLSNVQNFCFQFFCGFANYSAVTPSLPPVLPELVNLVAKIILWVLSFYRLRI